MALETFCLVAGVLLVAGGVQRLTGTGFAFVAGPAVAVAGGASEGVRLVLVASLVCTGYSFILTWRDSRLRQVAPLVPFMVLAIFPSSLLIDVIDTRVLSITSGVVVLVALILAEHPGRFLKGPIIVQGGIAGGLSGAMNTVAAIGGPMAAAYGIARDWGRSLVPNMQFYNFVAALAVLSARGWPGTVGWPQLSILLLATGVGVGVGNRLADHVSAKAATRLMSSVAAVGALAAIFRGLSGWS